MARLILPKVPRNLPEDLRDYLDDLSRTIEREALRWYQRVRYDHALFINDGSSNLIGVAPLLGLSTLALPSGASHTISNFIPPGYWLHGVFTENLTDITGSLTGYQVGHTTTLDAWGTGVGLLKGEMNDPAGTGWAERNISLYTDPDDVILTALGGTFSSGTIKIGLRLINLLDTPSNPAGA